VREGVNVEGGRNTDIQQGILGASDHTLLYPNPLLLERFKKEHQSLAKVTVIEPRLLPAWITAIISVMRERGIQPPG
jgi:hypothetical protein